MKKNVLKGLWIPYEILTNLQDKITAITWYINKNYNIKVKKYSLYIYFLYVMLYNILVNI